MFFPFHFLRDLCVDQWLLSNNRGSGAYPESSEQFINGMDFTGKGKIKIYDHPNKGSSGQYGGIPGDRRGNKGRF